GEQSGIRARDEIEIGHLLLTALLEETELCCDRDLVLNAPHKRAALWRLLQVCRHRRVILIAEAVGKKAERGHGLVPCRLKAGERAVEITAPRIGRLVLGDVKIVHRGQLIENELEAAR